MSTEKLDESLDGDRLLKRSELRVILSVAHELFRKWLNSGILPAPVLIDGTPRWHLSEVRAWLAKLPRRAAAGHEQEQEAA